jgi:hypothetical protein
MAASAVRIVSQSWGRCYLSDLPPYPDLLQLQLPLDPISVTNAAPT